MLAHLFNHLILIFPGLRAIMWKYIYQWSAQMFPMGDWKFMNFGYAPLDNGTRVIELEKKDITYRYSIQLYHYVATLVEILDLNILEVGSGRGGGAEYIKRYLKPRSVVGVDLSENLISFCQQNYQVEGLSFKVGDAESLPFKDASFEIIINIESSHCYSSMEKFLRQVQRVLCKDGYFLFADLRLADEITPLLELLHQSNLTLIKQTDITANVIKAMELDHERKMTWIQKSVNKILISTFSDLVGTTDSSIYKRLGSGEVVYQSFLLQKQMD
jgi:ubiquinone/menaquinone biosynthesis C-methylase UbiE